MMQAQVAVVTGANRGIGEAIAQSLRSLGWRVIATSREPRAGFETLDVTRAEQIDALARKLKAEGYGLDVLVNNAGLSLDGFDAEVARRTLDVNFFGTMNVTDALAPLMHAHARIVMVSSEMGALSVSKGDVRARFEDARLTRAQLVELMERFLSDVAAGVHARRGWPSYAYSASKMGINALVRVLARELTDDPRHILVNSADPGWVRTRMGGAGAPGSVEEGARTPVWLALLPPDGPTGGIFKGQRPVTF
jgi:carbonyl reductase 1